MSFSFFFTTVLYGLTFFGEGESGYSTIDRFEPDREADRTYYLQCVEEIWDYAPLNKNGITGEDITSPTEDAGQWLYGTDDVSNEWIGSKYWKALYREYTDDTFTVQMERGRDELHLGVVGPAIRAIAGERVAVVYKNGCSFDSSIHGHGVAYDKSSEGAPYDDDTTDGDVVLPGESWTYIWDFRPSMIDKYTSSKLWLYHSHVDETNDIHAGLIGPIIVTAEGSEGSSTDLRPRHIDHEFVAFFVLFDENISHLFAKNQADFSPNVRSVEDEAYVESNLMHAINGYLFGNSEDFVMHVGDTVRWYIASFGNEADGPHSPHWHGNIVNDRGESVDTVLVIPATTLTVDMECDREGHWLFHCHVNDHIHAGMLTLYDVRSG